MDTFFFIARKDKLLHKIYFKSVLVNLENINYLDSIKSYYTKITRSFSNGESDDSPESIKKLYIYGINKNDIFFPHQLANIDYFNSSIFSQDEISELFIQSSIFFKNNSYEDFDQNSDYFNRFRHILIPEDFITKLNHTISYCFDKLQFIENNYETIIKKDLENMKNKNKLLKSLAVLEMKGITNYPKKRETVDYLLFDLDLEITNMLITSLNIKYNKLATDDSIEISKIINNSYLQTKNIEIFIQNNIEKFII